MPLAAEKLVESSLVHSTPAPETATGQDRDTKPVGSFFSWLYPVVCVGGMALLLVMYLCQSAKIVDLQYRTVQLKEREAALTREKTDLTLRVQELTSLARIEDVATHRLGMVLPRQRLVLDLSEASQRQAYLQNAVAEQREPAP